MHQSKEEREVSETSWHLLFTVTGISLILFSYLLKFLEGKQHRYMFFAGVASIIIAAIAYLGRPA